VRHLSWRTPAAALLLEASSEVRFIKNTTPNSTNSSMAGPYRLCARVTKLLA
jgi:hypothetical protein